jgi:hypothetical protein
MGFGRKELKIETGHTVEAQDAVRFVCPFCKLNGSAGEVAHPGTPSRVPYVMHDVPECEKFQKLEPDEYLRAVREHYGGN